MKNLMMSLVRIWLGFVLGFDFAYLIVFSPGQTSIENIKTPMLITFVMLQFSVAILGVTMLIVSLTKKYH